MNPDKVYWDACTYLDYLAGDHELRDLMAMVMEDWKRGLVTLVTSTLTLSQVYFVRAKGGGPADRTRDEDIDALFDPPPPRKLLTVELSRFTALRARDLSRTMSLSWDDAIHVASALEAHVPLLHTTDQGMWTKSGQVGGTPTLKIEQPSWLKQTEAVERIEPGRFTSLVVPTEPEPPLERSPDDVRD